MKRDVKNMAAAILSKRKPKEIEIEIESGDEDEMDEEEGQIAAAEKLIDAVHSENPKMIIKAFCELRDILADYEG